MLIHAEEIARRHTDLEGAIERPRVRWHKRTKPAPEPGRLHVEERVETEPAEVIERVSRGVRTLLTTASSDSPTPISRRSGSG